MTSLQEVYVSVKGLIATNLSTMGVTGYSSSDGLTTLANAILEVEGGSDLTITLDLQSSSSSIQSGQTVNLTATLTATYDGETVDLNSVLQNAPITFKEGNTTINTVSTNANGVATISNYAPVGTGTVTLSAQFPSTDGFDGATDVITITVEDVSPVATTLSLTADKSILSYADRESATLSATVLDQFDAPMENQTVEFFNGSTSMGTATTNASGVATKSYSSTGVGDVSFTAEVGSLVSESFAITDAWKYVSSGSYTGTSAISFQEIYESSAYDNIEISATIKAPNKGFSLVFLKSKDSSSSIQDNIFTIGVDGANYTSITRIENGNAITYNSSVAQQYTANSNLNCVIRIENGVVTLKLNNLSYTSTPITGLKYVGVRNWNNAKTIIYTDFIVKPL